MVVLHAGLRCVLHYAACFSVPIVFFFSNQMKKALSLHRCTPLMVVILKNMTRQRVHATSAPLTARFSSLTALWMVSRMRSNLMQPHGGLGKTSQMLWRVKMALRTQRANRMTAVGATRRLRLQRSFHLHQRRHSSRQGSLPASVGMASLNS